jgi:hypothetical protein
VITVQTEFRRNSIRMLQPRILSETGINICEHKLHAQIPNEWKRSIIVPIYKKGDKRKPENYRGINLLNTCYKIFSKILNGKLKKNILLKISYYNVRMDL